MTQEQAKAFIKKVFEDEAFVEQLVALETDAERKQLAKEQGFEFTEDDVQAILPGGVTLAQLRDLEKSDELPDEITEAIVGGKAEIDVDVYNTVMGPIFYAAASV